MTRETAFRATRDDTLRYQQELRHLLETLIREDRPLRGEERDLYFDLLGKALLGVDFDFPNPVAPRWLERLWDQETYKKIRTVADYLRFMAYVEGGEGLSDFWKHALECVLTVSAKALEVATKISAEHIPRPPTGTHEW